MGIIRSLQPNPVAPVVVNSKMARTLHVMAFRHNMTLAVRRVGKPGPRAKYKVWLLEK